MTIAQPRRSGWLLALSLVLAAALLVMLWFGLPVRNVVVSGNRHLSAEKVMQLAGVHRDFGWLYYGAWRAGGLLRDPWVRSATITRVFPDTVHVQVTERVPAARIVVNGESRVVAWDQVHLPGVWLAQPVVRGWGPDRTAEALEVARLLARYNVRSVDYSPSGMTVKTANGTLWSGSLVSLQKYATGVTMYADKHVNIYPWGVSVQE